MFHVEHRRMDYHLHTNHSMDGRQTMPELCETMLARGVQEIALTEHIEPGHPEEEMDVPPVWADWFAEIARCRAAYPALVIRSGIEIGDNPLCRAETKALLDTLPLDFRLLSLHLVNGVDCYDSEKYFAGKTRAQAYREYAEAKAESILDWEDFDSVAHIGYVVKFSIYTGKERALVYVYRQEALAALLAQADVQAFLRAMSYGDTSPDGALAFLRQRLTESPCFPHEIGVFLGYPLSDVIAFMRDGGRGCRCSGCWKAYTNECEAMRVFQRYKACRAAYQTLFRAGWPLERLTVRA